MLNHPPTREKSAQKDLSALNRPARSQLSISSLFTNKLQLILYLKVTLFVMDLTSCLCAALFPHSPHHLLKIALLNIMEQKMIQ